MKDNVSNNMGNILDKNGMSEKAQLILSQNGDVRELLTQLTDNNCFSDVIYLLSCKLSLKNGIQWAAQFLNSVDKKIKPNNYMRFESINLWLKNPNKNSFTLPEIKTPISNMTPSNWLSLATFWLSENFNATIPTNPDYLIKDAIYSSVMLSIMENPAMNQQGYFEKAIFFGKEILEHEINQELNRSTI